MDRKFSKYHEDILNGKITKTLFLLGWPLMIGGVIQTVYNLIDTFWLGKLGKEAVTAPLNTWPFVFLMISFAMGVAVAGIALVSQYIGAKEKEKANEAATQVFVFMFLMAIAIGVTGFLASPMVLKLMSVPEEIFDIVLSYMRIIFLGMPFMFSGISFDFLLRGFGDMKTPVIVGAIAAGLNTVLDPLMIFGIGFFPRMEVSGAALATIISRAFVSVIAIYLLFYGKVGIHLRKKYLKPKKEIMKKIITIGIPASIGQSGVAFGFVILMKFVNKIGVLAIGAYGIGNRLTNILFMVTGGITGASTTMIGQNLGADQEKRAENVALKTMKIVFLILMIGAIGMYIFREDMYRVFIDDMGVINEGANFIKLFVFSLPFFAVFQTVSATFQGAGQTKQQMIFGLIRLWGLRIPLCYILAFTLSYAATGIWIGMALSNILGSFVAFLWFLKGSWKKKVI